MVIDSKFIGKSYPPITYKIGVEKVKEFILATKGDITKHSNYIPLTFPVVYASKLLESVLYDSELNLNLQKLVHGEQEFIYHKPVTLEDTVCTEGKILNIFSKKIHDFVVFQTESFNQNNDHVCTMKWTFVVRGGNNRNFSIKEKALMKLAAIKDSLCKKNISTKVEDLNINLIDGSITSTTYIDKYMPQRYAGASGDFNAIHLDEGLGLNVGLGGYILHGMATMALASNTAMASLESPETIKNFKTRFSAPVKPGDKLSFQVIQENNTMTIISKNQDSMPILEQTIIDF